jgi:hypothetical protein
MTEWAQVIVAVGVPLIAAVGGLYKMLWDIKSDIRLLVHDAKQTEADLIMIKKSLARISERVTALEARHG